MEDRTPPSPSRRRALGRLIAGAGALASGRLLASDGGSHLSENAPEAKALGYLHDHRQVDPEAWPRKAGPAGAEQHCASCTLFIDLGGEWGLCSLFPGKEVNRNGWCNNWSGT
jgi:hypothetical protein